MIYINAYIYIIHTILYQVMCRIERNCILALMRLLIGLRRFALRRVMQRTCPSGMRSRSDMCNSVSSAMELQVDTDNFPIYTYIYVYLYFPVYIRDPRERRALGEGLAGAQLGPQGPQRPRKGPCMGLIRVPRGVGPDDRALQEAQSGP